MIKKCFSLAAALLAALLLPALFASCLNPTQDKLSGSRDTTDWEDEEYPDYGDPLYEDGENAASVSHKSFVIDAVAGLPAEDTDANAAGKLVATLTLPEQDGPWRPELAADLDDNDKFELVPQGEDGKYQICIKEGQGPLPIGPYTISLNIRNGAGAAFYRVIKFSVAKTPPPFKTPPKVFPYITDVGKNKLVVYWDEAPSGSIGFRIYIGTTNKSADATAYTTAVITEKTLNEEYKNSFSGTANPTYTKYSAEITDLTWDSTDGYLPNDTTYYVWLKSYNSEGDSAFGPYATRTTSATLPEILWKNVNIDSDPKFGNVSIAKDSDFDFGEAFYGWDSYYGGGGAPTGDCYVITPSSTEHPGGYIAYGPPNDASQGEIVYVSLSYHSAGKGKWGEPLSGYASNIIYKLTRPDEWGKTEDSYYTPEGARGVKRYMCVNYYGLGTVQTVGPEGRNSTVVGPQKLSSVGRILCYFGNCYDLDYRRNPETDTPEQAIAKFDDGDKSLGSGHYIAGIAVPWYRDYWIDRSQPFSEWFK
jgi:hypothetical protein